MVEVGHMKALLNNKCNNLKAFPQLLFPRIHCHRTFFFSSLLLVVLYVYCLTTTLHALWMCAAVARTADVSWQATVCEVHARLLALVFSCSF